MKRISSIPLFLFALVMLAITSSCGLKGRYVYANVPDMGICLDYDEETQEPIDITNNIPSNSERIIVYYLFDSSNDWSVTIRWLYEGELIIQYTTTVHEGYNFAWISRESDEKWQEGNYTVEIAFDESFVLRQESFFVVE